MATIAENLQTIQTIKNNIKTSIENKGVSVGDVSFTEYSTKIDEIATGGGGVLESITITENGTYTPNEGVDGYNEVNVNVQPSDNYTYYDGGVDVEGLRAIGWSDESIGMLRDNAPHYSWQNDDFIVSEENKALYGDITSTSEFKEKCANNVNITFLPMPDAEYMITSLGGCKYIKGIPLLDTSRTTSISSMFSGCSSLITIPHLNTSNMTNMYCMFAYCEKLVNIPLLNTIKVRDMEQMFNRCVSLITIPHLVTSNVYTMRQMFSSCTNLTTIPLLDTSNVNNMQSMFHSCTSLQSIPQLNTSNVTDMEYMFYNCTSLTTIPELNTSNVTDMQFMFSSCSSLTTIPLLDTSKVTTMRNMFSSCSSLTTIPAIDTSKVIAMSNMFSGCTKLQSLPLLDMGGVSSSSNISTFFGYGNITTLTDLGGFKNLKIDWKDGYGLINLPNLTYQSVMNVINNLYDFRGNGDTTTTRTIKFNAKSIALLSDADIAIATNKGWVIS